MLTQELDLETEQYLADILAREQTTTNELIRQLIRDRWVSLHSAETLTFTETTEDTDNLKPNKHKNSKQLIADFIKKKNQRAVY